MKPVSAPTSQPASPEMAAFVLAVRDACRTIVHPAGARSAAGPPRRQLLRTERAELLGMIAQAEHEAGRLGGDGPTDASRTTSLRTELATLRRRLAEINAQLGPAALE